MTFNGFPYAGVDFFQELRQFNNREWWAAHQSVYLESVRQPFETLLAMLSPEFGRTILFGPRRKGDEELAKTAPYKEHQAAFASSPNGHVWYLHLDGDGLMAGGGSYVSTADQIDRYRAAVLDEFSGYQLQRIITLCQRQGFRVEGRTIEEIEDGSSPYYSMHPRADLLRHQTLHIHYYFGTPPWLSTPKAADKVYQAWNAARPLVDWLDAYVGRPKPMDAPPL